MAVLVKSQIDRLVDLTRLKENDSVDEIIAFCEKAKTYNQLAAVCVYPQFVNTVKQQLNDLFRIATVINFPKGDGSIATITEQTKQAIEDGADEIDLVIPYKSLQQGDQQPVIDVLTACSAICKNHALLKVIIESGALTPEQIRQACQLCLHAKVDFIKTSTGKIQPGATLEAVAIILDEIKQINQHKAGIKISGGIRTYDQANDYLQLITEKMGENWISANTVRFGTSQLN